jgi:hypothetical protein
LEVMPEGTMDASVEAPVETTMQVMMGMEANFTSTVRVVCTRESTALDTKEDSAEDTTAILEGLEVMGFTRHAEKP